MDKKSHLLLLVIFSSILLLGGNITPIHSYDYDWALREQYLFSMRDYNYEEKWIKNGNYDFNENLVEYQMNFNITNIDFDSKTLDLTYYNPYGNLLHSYDYNFDMVYFSNYFSQLDDIIYINYIWDTNTESIILRDFAINIWFQPRLFVEPNWTIFNQVWINAFNGSTVVDIVYNPVIEMNVEINFNYFLDSLTSFTFNNKKSLNDALNQFTSSNTELSFHFDLSNMIYEPYFDSELARTVYLPMEEYFADFQMRYTKGGILEFFTGKTEYTFSQEDNYYNEIDEFTRVYGGLKSLDNPFFIIIPSLILSVLIMKFSLKKKKEKVINGQ